jgi:predicted  nucleic acid-binding Zn-ribbon protein
MGKHVVGRMGRQARKSDEAHSDLAALASIQKGRLWNQEEKEQSMTPRDAYVRKLKEQLDRWNAEISKVEARAKQPLVNMKEAYEKQLKELRDRRNVLQQQMAEIQKASDHAWDELREGADKSWKAMEESFKKAWAAFK